MGKDKKGSDGLPPKNAKEKWDDDTLWKAVTKDVRPLKGKPKISKTPLSQDKPDNQSTVSSKDTAQQAYELSLRQSRKSSDISFSRLKDLDTGDTSHLDGRRGQKFRRGKISYEATLDLHGFTQSEAYQALESFVFCAYKLGQRCVLVITGKGKGLKGGVLQQSLPKWLNGENIRPYILSFSFAKPSHGGQGAYYIYIKKKK